MRNIFKSRNFDRHHESLCYSCPDLDMTASNTIYDSNRGITHMIVKDSQKCERIISDVEICMSDSPEITALFTAEYRAKLRAGIMSQSRPSDVRPAGVSDDDLVDLIVPHSLERDEVASIAKERVTRFHRKAVSDVLEDGLQSKTDVSSSDTPINE